MASALAAAHGKRLLHRDVKPANILIAFVDDAEHAYLTDFGIAKLEQAATGLTRTGMMVGTIDYMPPERIEGQPGDARSDIYSLGCVLYEMLTGEPPFVRENEGARMYAHMSAEIPWATDVAPRGALAYVGDREAGDGEEARGSLPDRGRDGTGAGRRSHHADGGRAGDAGRGDDGGKDQHRTSQGRTAAAGGTATAPTRRPAAPRPPTRGAARRGSTPCPGAGRPRAAPPASGRAGNRRCGRRRRGRRRRARLGRRR